MRNPTTEQTYKILTKLADDTVHKTHDLFPTLQGDDLIAPSEWVIRLGELGYLTHGPVYRLGFNKIPRGVIQIRITPEGHEWLAAHVDGNARSPGQEMNCEDTSRRFARLAVEEARKSVSEPDGRAHPMVGAVIVKNQQVLSTAHRGELPANHAEYIALEGKLSDEAVSGATVYTTLEPCTTRNHPKIPCADRIIERKVSKVVIGMLDPDERIRGLGVQKLRDANIDVEFFPPKLMAENFGAWYTLALAVGAGWLAKVLIVDAVISPAGAGVVYVGATARLSYALGEEREMPSALSTTNKKGVPVISVLVAAVIGSLAFGPYKSWTALVNVVTGATAIMYAFAPVSLAALHKVDGNRPRSYRTPLPKVVLPAAFCSANLIIYWGGFDSTWKLTCAMLVGLALFALGTWRSSSGAQHALLNAIWIGPWIGGLVVIGLLGRYGLGARNILPEWVDIGAVTIFSLVIFYWAVSLTYTAEQTVAAIARDAQQLDYDAWEEWG